MATNEKKEVQKVVIKPTSKKNEAKATTKKGTTEAKKIEPRKPVAKAAPKAPAAPKKPVTPKAPTEPKAAKPAEKKATPVKIEVPKTVKASTASAKTVYHVTKRDRDGREWKVFIQGSNKVIKLFDTQVEALEYAQSLCKNKDDGSYVLLHGLNGKIRKY